MKITRLNMASLKKGFLIESDNGFLILKSNCNPHRNEYKYVDTVIDEDGNITESGELQYISAYDLMGGEICC